MQEKSRWVVRRVQCPGEKGKADLLMEWRIQKGKKILHSIHCDHPRLADYSGKDCQWLCWPKLGRRKE